MGVATGEADCTPCESFDYIIYVDYTRDDIPELSVNQTDKQNLLRKKLADWLACSTPLAVRETRGRVSMQRLNLSLKHRVCHYDLVFGIGC